MRVLYIAGHGRSGSTLLEKILAQVDGLVAVGELRQIWKRGFAEDHLCGCGEAFSACRFWASVTARARDLSPGFDPREGLRLQKSVDRTRRVPRLLTARRGSAFGREVTAYAAQLGALYEAVAAESSGAVVIDSSKDPSMLFVLRHVPGIDLRVVHLVRDSRAVAFSWQRKKVWESRGGEELYFDVYTAGAAAREWTWRNLLASLARRRAAACMVLRYEDLVADPAGATARVLELVGRTASLDFIGEEGAVLDRPVHSVSGNPLRFGQGAVTIRPDSEWLAALPRRDRAVATAYSWPLLLAYGYPLRPWRRSAL